MKKLWIEILENALINKQKSLKEAIYNTQQSANNETKSSAGDKYETGRAMAQNEIMLLQSQLLQVENQIFEFSKINFSAKTETIKNGTLVNSSIGQLLIGVGFGKITNENISLMCISATSPLALALIGKQKGDIVLLNGNKIEVLGLA